MSNRIIVFFIIIVLFFGAKSAMAFNGQTHKYLWKQAISNIDILKCTKSQQNYILNIAPIEPDFAKDKSDHICYPNNCPAIKKVDELIKKAKIEKNFCQKMIILASASHYLADAENPVHQQSESSVCHSDFESKVGQLINSKTQNDFTLKCSRNFWGILWPQYFSFNKKDINSIILDIKAKILIFAN